MIYNYIILYIGARRLYCRFDDANTFLHPSDEIKIYHIIVKTAGGTHNTTKTNGELRRRHFNRFDII